MKTFFVLLAFSFFYTTPPTFLVIDKQLKKPVGHCDDFSPELFRKGTFPIYSTDLNALVEAIDKTAKKINGGTTCAAIDTIKANHSSIYIFTRCQPNQTVSVLLVTNIATPTTNTDFSIELVQPESNSRNAQRKILDFSAYLTK